MGYIYFLLTLGNFTWFLTVCVLLLSYWWVGSVARESVRVSFARVRTPLGKVGVGQIYLLTCYRPGAIVWVKLR